MLLCLSKTQIIKSEDIVMQPTVGTANTSTLRHENEKASPKVQNFTSRNIFLKLTRLVAEQQRLRHEYVRQSENGNVQIQTANE